MNSDTAFSGTLTRPNQVCDPNQDSAHTHLQWFNTYCMVAPPHYTFGNANVGSSTYGQITSAGTQRQMQAAMRLTF